jgi:hypothetical protein
MPRNTETTQEAKTFIPKDEYKQLVEAAEAEGVTVAEYMRRALRVRLTSQGVDAQLAVKRGGDRKEVLPTRREAPEGERSGVLCIDTTNTP